MRFVLLFLFLILQSAYVPAADAPFGSTRLDLQVPQDDRVLPLQIYFPAGTGRYPLIVLSHGTFSAAEKYARIAEYWASQGYVVILPDHVDANYGTPVRSIADMRAIILSRTRDMSFVLDQLASVESGLSGFTGRIDSETVIAAGHSVGSYVAMLVTGLEVRDPEADLLISHDEDRYGAVIMISDPGKMAMMPDDLWLHVSVPTLLVTGTDDYGVMGDGRRAAEYQNEILTPVSGPPHSKYLIEIENGDHYFGGLIHRETDAEPDFQALEIFNRSSIVFLDSVTGADGSTQNLSQAGVAKISGGRASLQVR